MESLVLLLFAVILTICVAAGVSILWGLAAGWFLFAFYALKHGFTVRRVLKLSADGIRTVRTILLIFILIGMLTAFWRGAGTIPAIVCAAAGLISPALLYLAAFLLNCFVSFLTGTSFGTVATMGVVCAAIGRAMGADGIWLGGAILSGIYFGDRCSPVSTSALLTAQVTKTEIYRNIRHMFRSAAVPFAVSCAVYWAAGLADRPSGQTVTSVQSLFSARFYLGWPVLLPAVLILVLASFRVNVKVSMLCSIVCAAVCCAVFQGMAPLQILQTAVFGFRSGDPEIASLTDGGGILSMLRTAATICISSAYAGIFRETSLLDGIRARICSLEKRTSAFFAVLVTATLISLISCSQTLSILMSQQICEGLEKDPEQFALDLEDSAVVVSPLIPWSIAGSVPLAALAAPSASVLTACYLYLLPVCRLLFPRSGKLHENGAAGGVS